MLSNFLFFLSGILTYKFFQYLLAITPVYNIFKHSEQTALGMLANLQLIKINALKILKITYENSDNTEEYVLAEKEINSRYDALINSCIENIKKYLPYKVPYNNLNEALIYNIVQSNKERKDE